MDQPIFDLLYLGATLMLLFPAAGGVITFEFVRVHAIEESERRVYLQPIDGDGTVIPGLPLYDIREPVLEKYAILDDEWKPSEE